MEGRNRDIIVDFMYGILYNILDNIQKGERVMVAVNYTKARNNLKEYCDKATEDNETVIVTRKEDKDVVIISLARFNEMEKMINNALYLAKIDRALDQLHSGKGQVHELIEG